MRSWSPINAVRALVAIAVLSAASVGCSGGADALGSSGAIAAETTTGPSGSSGGAHPSTSDPWTQAPRMRDFDSAGFSDPTTIDNPWFPMVPGRRLVWKGHAFEKGRRVSRKVVFIATDMTKVVGGVETRVIQELDFDDGVLSEKEIAFFAQDDKGNIWQMGQFPEELAGEDILKTPIWIHGVRDARAGVSMKGHPVLGLPSYAQGLGPDVGWNDRAETFALDSHACSALDCYTGVMVVREFNPGERNASQLKYYAQGIGTVRVDWRGSGEKEREEMVLVSISRLDVRGLARLDRDVLDQDHLGFELSPKVYGVTDAIEPAA